MKIESQDLILEYYMKVKDQYPGLSFEEFKLCCTVPFIATRKAMESGELPVIRLKYFATFLVYPKRASSILERMKKQFSEMKLDAKIFFAKKTMIEKFLEQNEEQDKIK